MTTSRYCRDYCVGYSLGVFEQDDVNFELCVDAQRRESPTEGGASNGFMGRPGDARLLNVRRDSRYTRRPTITPHVEDVAVGYPPTARGAARRDGGVRPGAGAGGAGVSRASWSVWMRFSRFLPQILAELVVWNPMGDRNLVPPGRPHRDERGGPVVPHLRSRAAALEALGWTGRNAEWLALVCLHSGVFSAGSIAPSLAAPRAASARRCVSGVHGHCLNLFR